MKKTLFYLLCGLILISWNLYNQINAQNKNQTEIEMEKNKKGKVTGIGGIFFKCKDTEKIKQWYNENLGIPTDEYGSMFEFRSADNPEQKGYLQWSPFSEKTKYFEPSEKDFMINYRVENIEELIDELKKNGVTIVDSLETFEYGKFIHIMDPENNKIELWEPADNALEK